MKLDLKEWINKVCDALELKRQTTPTALHSLFTNINGSCYRQGKLVIVQLQLYVNGTFVANDYYTALSGLPEPYLPSSLQVTTNSTTAKGASATVLTGGAMRIDSGVKPLSNETLFITGIYLTN